MNQFTSHAVFVADDDDDDRLLLQLAFQQSSPECQLVFAGDGLSLLDALNQHTLKPCLIILDLNMPRLNGFEVLATLRTNSLYQNVPVVILTTSNSAVERQRAYDLGANDFITKPLSLPMLETTVRQLRKQWHLDACL